MNQVISSFLIILFSVELYGRLAPVQHCWWLEICHSTLLAVKTPKLPIGKEQVRKAKARRDHWSLIIEDHKSLMKVGPPQTNFKLKKFKVNKFLS